MRLERPFNPGGGRHHPPGTPPFRLRSDDSDADRDVEAGQLIEPVTFSFSLSRRSFVQIVGAGVLISVAAPTLFGQQRRRGGGRGGAPAPISARIHFGDDGTISVSSGKVDAGQGLRGELQQAAAEELRVPLDQVEMVIGDTELCPNDGNTAGSGTTPRTVPAVRQAAAAVRELLIAHAAAIWGVEPAAVELREGKLTHPASNRSASYSEIAQDEQLLEKFSEPAPADIRLTPPENWQVLGTSAPQPNARDKVTGRHAFPSDIRRPEMLYGRILRPAAYGARLASVDLAPAEEIPGGVAVRDGDFVGVAAPSTYHAQKVIEALADTAEWERQEGHPSSDELFDHLRENASGGMPANPFAAAVDSAAKSLKATYHVAYVQHAPLEPRAAVAEWQDGKLTVWTATQNTFGVRGELARALRVNESDVRVIVPDFGSAYGGKHTGETAVEAARLAREAGRPVALKWTREEEFTWAAFRPAALIDLEASLDADNRLTSWYHINVNSGASSIESPYDVPQKQSRSVGSRPPLRHGSYRALASTANTFARESFMDELANLAGADPLEFRLAHLDHPRLRPVLEEAAKRFGWSERRGDTQANRGIGLACSLDKGSFVAACVEVEVEPQRKTIAVRHICETFECGAVLNPDNVRAQVEGAIIMALGPALTEEMRFVDGVIQNGTFRQYRTPRFADVPTLDIHVMDRRDLRSEGAGETPLIPVAAAIGNAVFHAIGVRVRSMPIRLV